MKQEEAGRDSMLAVDGGKRKKPGVAETIFWEERREG